ncbi:hypothetical protein [Brevundimonas diminuta]|uniref:hypothetical protein n=1 Tax=Brevundimonas diminuta TaxID=293 RepID=UPI003209BA3D
MADTPRVTVPVERWTDVITPAVLTDDQLNEAWKAPGGEGEFWGLWEDKPHRLIYRLLGHIKALSAAPAPEGVAEDWQPIETAPQNGAKIDLWGHWPEHDRWARTPDAAWDEERCDWKVNGFYAGQYAHPPRFTHWRAISGPAALATREEAPAEAGEMEWRVDYNAVVAVSAYLQNQRLFDSAKAVERMLSRAAAYRNCRDTHAELAALRAQPPAREDALRVAWTSQENMAILKGGRGAATMWPTNHGRSTPFALYTHPAPDALRVAVEALEEIADTDPDDGTSWFHERANQALAALQAEQKGGAV